MVDLVYPVVMLIFILTLLLSTASAIVASLKNRNEIAWIFLGLFWIPFLVLVFLPKLSKHAPTENASEKNTKWSRTGHSKTTSIAVVLLTIIWSSVIYGYYTSPDLRFDIQTAWSCMWDFTTRRTQLVRFGREKQFNIRFEYYNPNFDFLEEWKRQDKFVNLLEEEFSEPFDGRRMWVVQRYTNQYTVLLAVKTGLHTDPETINQMKRHATDFSRKVFNGMPVDLHMCDLFLETLRVVPSQRE